MELVLVHHRPQVGIAFTSLMFRKNPSFQLAMALLILFVSYVRAHIVPTKYAERR